MFRLKKISDKAFENWIIDNQTRLYKIAYTYVKNEHDALDIIQEGILKAYKNLGKLRDKSLLDKWVIRIIVNTALDYIKKRKKTLVYDPIIIGEIIESMDEKEVEVSVNLEYLPSELQEIIILKYFHGYTINEIGEILNISISSVKNRLHKALDLLRKGIKEDDYEGF